MHNDAEKHQPSSGDIKSREPAAGDDRFHTASMSLKWFSFSFPQHARDGLTL